MMINIGALIGQIGMVFAERYVGFYLAFLLPTIMFIIAPIVMFVFGKQYHKRPPTGSVLGKTFKLVSLGFKESRKAKKRSDGSAQQGFFERVKPSHLQSRPSWMTFDDAWVDEVRRGLLACRVFLWYPLCKCPCLRQFVGALLTISRLACLLSDAQQPHLASSDYGDSRYAERHHQQHRSNRPGHFYSNL